MEISEYKNIYDNEKEHFFYVSTHRLVIGLIKRWFGSRKNLKVLDAGCGTGGLMDQLTKYGNVTGIDFSPEAVKFSRTRGHKTIRGSVEKIPFTDQSFDLVTSIDVIYHRAVKSDMAALLEFRRVLKPGGILILRVPANKFLMSAHDRHVHSMRRYSKTELTNKLSEANLKIKQISFVHMPLFIVSLFRVLVEKIIENKNESGVGKVGVMTNKFLIGLLSLENNLLFRGIQLPFGQGLIAVGQRLAVR